MGLHMRLAVYCKCWTYTCYLLRETGL